MGATALFLEEMAQVAQARPTAQTRRAVRMRLIDYIAVTLAGAAMNGARAQALADLTGAQGSAPLLGLARNSDFQTAAALNAMSAHVAELDDGDRFAMFHPGAPVISALLGHAVVEGWTWDAMERAIIVGYEGGIRLARTVQPALKQKGLHASGACGAIGAALGLAAGMGLKGLAMDAALSAAATTSAGLLKVIRGRSELKPYNVGAAARSGVMAVQMAQAGFPGPGDVLDGPDGLLALLGQGEYPRVIGANASGLPCVETVYVKPYASCRHCHAPVEAAMVLARGQAIDPAAIARVEVATHKMAVHLHDHQIIEGVNSGKMSIPYSVAAALICGHGGMEGFSAARVSDPNFLALTSRVFVREDPQMTALVPNARPAEVTITLHGGARHSLRVDLPLGEPETALSDSQMRVKFVDLLTFAGHDPSRSGDIFDAMLDPQISLQAIFEMLGLGLHAAKGPGQ